MCTESIGGFPSADSYHENRVNDTGRGSCMIVGDLGADIVQDVGHRDAVGKDSTEVSEEGSSTTKRRMIERKECAVSAIETL